MTKRIGICLLLALLILLLLLLLYLLIGGVRELEGDGIHFIREEPNMSTENRSLEHPAAALLGESGGHVPADREIRAKVYDTAKESRR